MVTKKKFTCVDSDGDIVVVRGKSLEAADLEVCADLIVKGTLENIGARKIKWAPSGAIWAEDTKLERSNVCTLTVGDPIRIAGAVFLGKKNINDAGFLAWQKNGVRFWTFTANTQLTYVGGKRVGIKSD